MNFVAKMIYTAHQKIEIEIDEDLLKEISMKASDDLGREIEMDEELFQKIMEDPNLDWELSDCIDEFLCARAYTIAYANRKEVNEVEMIDSYFEQ